MPCKGERECECECEVRSVRWSAIIKLDVRLIADCSLLRLIAFFQFLEPILFTGPIASKQAKKCYAGALQHGIVWAGHVLQEFEASCARHMLERLLVRW